MVDEKLKSKRKVLPGNKTEIMAIEMEDGVGKKLHVAVFYFPPQKKAKGMAKAETPPAFPIQACLSCSLQSIYSSPISLSVILHSAHPSYW